MAGRSPPLGDVLNHLRVLDALYGAGLRRFLTWLIRRHWDFSDFKSLLSIGGAGSLLLTIGRLHRCAVVTALRGTSGALSFCPNDLGDVRIATHLEHLAGWGNGPPTRQLNYGQRSTNLRVVEVVKWIGLATLHSYLTLGCATRVEL